MPKDLTDKAIVIRDEIKREGNTAVRVGGWMVQASDEIDTSVKEFDLKLAATKEDLENQIANATTNDKGIFSTLAELQASFPKATNKKDFFAFVGTANPRKKYAVKADSGDWTDTGELHNVAEVALGEYAKIKNDKGETVVYAKDGIIIAEGVLTKAEVDYINGALPTVINKVESTVPNRNLSELTGLGEVKQGYSITGHIKVKKGDVITINSSQTVTFYTTDLNKVAYFIPPTSVTPSQKKREIVVEGDYSNMVFALLTEWTDSIYCYINAKGDSKYDKSKITRNSYINELTGAISPNVYACVTDFITAGIGSEIEFNSNRSVAFYNAKKELVSFLPPLVPQSSQEKRTISVTNTAISYFRFTILNEWVDSAYCYIVQIAEIYSGIPSAKVIHKNVKLDTILEQLIQKDDAPSLAASTNYSLKLVGDPRYNAFEVQQTVDRILFNSSLNNKISTYYVKAKYESDIYFSFNFSYLDFREGTPDIEFFITLSDGTIYRIAPWKSHMIRVMRKDLGATAEVGIIGRAITSTISIQQSVKNNKIVLTVGDFVVTIDSLTIIDMHFDFRNSPTLLKTIGIENIRSSMGVVAEIALEGLSITIPPYSFCRVGIYMFVSYFAVDKRGMLARINLKTSKIEETVSLSTSVGMDGHNYLAVEVDSYGGIHVAGNAHNMAVAYFYGKDYMNLVSVAKSTALNDVSTYPKFMLGDDDILYYSVRIGGSGSSVIIVYAFNGTSWDRTTEKNIIDNSGGSAYLTDWVLHDGWFYNAWCWRDGDPNTTNQVNLIKTKNFSEFFGYAGEPLTLPITKEENPSYCIDPVPIKSKMLNKHTTFAFDNKVCVYYTKSDSNGVINLFIAAPSKDGKYDVHKISKYAYVDDRAEANDMGAALSVIDATVRGCGYYLEVNIGHKVFGGKTIKINQNFEIVEEIASFQDAIGRDPVLPATVTFYKESIISIRRQRIASVSTITDGNLTIY